MVVSSYVQPYTPHNFPSPTLSCLNRSLQRSRKKPEACKQRRNTDLQLARCAGSLLGGAASRGSRTRRASARSTSAGSGASRGSQSGRVTGARGLDRGGCGHGAGLGDLGSYKKYILAHVRRSYRLEA